MDYSEIRPNQTVYCKQCCKEGKWDDFAIISKIGDDEYLTLKCPHCNEIGHLDGIFQLQI